MRVPMTLVRRHCVALFYLSLLTAGCGASVLDLRDNLDLNQASFHDKLATKQALAEEFVACTRQAYDERTGTSPGAFSSDDQYRPADHLSAIHALITRVKETRPSHADSLQIFEDALTDWESASHRRLDLTKLRKIIDVIRRWQVHLDFDEDALAGDVSRFGQLLLAYNKAYFGDIRYMAGSPAGGTGIRAVAKLVSTGFTDRNGNVWMFPGLSIEATKESGKSLTIESSHVDSQRISADLTRVFLEAFFDAAFREPAVQNATALQVQWKKVGQIYPAFDADHPPIPLEAFARITRDALRAEAAVTSEVGKAVRGGNIFSIQNETYAATLETAAGVIAKKLVEHEGFCYFQTIQQSQNKKETHPITGAISGSNATH
jgi:hypothetical protein